MIARAGGTRTPGATLRHGREDTLIAEGTRAPGFTLQDQFGRKVSLDDFRDRTHVLLLFYPLDWTPT
jgi:cytochrome oxidase Cu insertion factor (SCO1/SenC/PrrC family)